VVGVVLVCGSSSSGGGGGGSSSSSSSSGGGGGSSSSSSSSGSNIGGVTGMQDSTVGSTTEELWFDSHHGKVTFYLLHSVQTDYGVHPPSYSTDN